jgi:predicted RNase H-like HicB family nuclease
MGVEMRTAKKTSTKRINKNPSTGLRPSGKLNPVWIEKKNIIDKLPFDEQARIASQIKIDNKILFIREAMKRAYYERIEDEEPFLGRIKGLRGVWATGKTLKACQIELESTLKDWIDFGLDKNLPIPKIGKYKLN